MRLRLRINAERAMATFSPTQLMRDLWYLLYFVSGDGSWKLRSHERAVLDAAIAHLTSDAKKIVAEQLRQRYFIERTNKRINLFRYYATRDVLRIPDPEFSDLLLRVQILVEAKKEFAHVIFYKGHLFSIEFKNLGRSYAHKELVVVDVVRGKTSQTYTRAIDRLEHGRDSESSGR
jgi:hypothetical protein